MKTAAELRVGEHAIVAEVAGQDALAARLMEMGLTPGVPVSLLGVAPLGDPLELSLRGYRLSLRRTEARRVMLKPESEPTKSPPAAE